MNITESDYPAKFVADGKAGKLTGEAAELFDQAVRLGRISLGEDVGIGQKALIGVGRGMTDIGEGIKQIGLKGGELIGAVDKGRADEYQRQVDEERAMYEHTPVGKSGVARATRFATNIAPALALPVAGTSALGVRAGAHAAKIGLNAARAGMAAEGALGGAALGAAQYVPEGGSRLENTAFGAGLGAAAPYATKVLKTLAQVTGSGAQKLTQKVKDIGGPFRGNPTEALRQKMVGDVDTKAMEAKMRSARTAGADFITPGEATGNQRLLLAEKELGQSKKGAEQIYQKTAAREANIEDTIQSTLDNIGQYSDEAPRNMATSVAEAFDKKIAARQEKATPLYEKAYQSKVTPSIWRAANNAKTNPIISSEIKKLMQEPTFAQGMKGYDPASVKLLHELKVRLRDIGEKAKLSDVGTYKSDAGKYFEASNKVKQWIEKLSPDYAKANKLYASDTEVLQEMMGTPLGKIRDMAQTDYKRIGALLFDPKQTEKGFSDAVRREVGRETWDQMVRYHMQQTLGATRESGARSSFYTNILAKDNVFNTYMNALKGTQHVENRKILKAMRNVYGDVKTPQAVAKLGDNFAPGNTVVQNVMGFAKHLVGGKYDQAQIELITNNKWHKEVIDKVVNEPSKVVKLKNLQKVLDKVQLSLDKVAQKSANVATVSSANNQSNQ